MSPSVNIVEFELQRYPVVVLRFPRTGTLVNIHAWYDEVERLLRKAEEPVALVHDLRRLELMGVTALLRAAVAERTLGLRQAGLDACIAADARIVNNPIVAGAVTVVSWLTGSTPWPQATFANERDAIEWAERALGKDTSDGVSRRL